MDEQYWKGDRTMSTNEWLLTSDFWQFLEPWHGRWYEYEVFIASCIDNIYHLQNERWLLGDMIDHVGIYGSRVAKGLSAFNVGLVFLAATKQLYEWFSPSVRLSVRLSVRPSVCPSVTPFWLCSYQRIIMKFSGVITKDKSDVHGRQRSKVKVTEVTTQLTRFRTVTPVWIHIWWWNDAYSLMMLRRGALLFLKVIRRISRSHGSKKRRIWPRLGVSGL